MKSCLPTCPPPHRTSWWLLSKVDSTKLPPTGLQMFLCRWLRSCTGIMHLQAIECLEKAFDTFQKDYFWPLSDLMGRCLLCRCDHWAGLRDVFSPLSPRGPRAVLQSRMTQRLDSWRLPSKLSAPFAPLPVRTMWPFCPIFLATTQRFFFRYFTLIRPCSSGVTQPSGAKGENNRGRPCGLSPIARQAGRRRTGLGGKIWAG